eukprot:TRINITY_DN3740_c1_g2_i1.p1 TRINITY_DN3740_c1_g2~~TRINITY_DN3740_c1_g2_i1.p1  ORF type:complete len:310 (-),score=9.00 TRINITY_DN3740_c1_g2_i1:284-1213(-)
MDRSVFLAQSQTILLQNMPSWWKNIQKSSEWQFGLYVGLAVTYGVVGLLAVIQLLRIWQRVPEYGWTTQKIFHLLNALVCIMRCVTFALYGFVGELAQSQNYMVQFFGRAVIYDFPALLFFTTYSLLVLFWAEIYHQANSKPTSLLRPMFFIVNAIVYVVQFGLLLVGAVFQINVVNKFNAVWLVVIFAAASMGFLIYGGRLFLMLSRFPLESKGRKRKVREVGAVTFICTIAFLARAIVLCVSIFGNNGSLRLDVIGHPLMNFFYYMLFEILPTVLVLYILRKLPPKRNPQGYQAIPAHQNDQIKGIV